MFHREKANCFAEKAITDNRRKTIAKTCKDNRSKHGKSPNFVTPGPIWTNIDNHRKCFTEKKHCFAEKAITDNRRKTIAKPVKTIAAKVLILKPQTLYELILTITVNVSQRKSKLFRRKAISDNRRKTIAKPVKTIAAKVLILKPQTLYELILTITVNVSQRKSKLFRRKSH